MGYLTVMNCLMAAAGLPLMGFLLLLIWGSRMGGGGKGAGMVGLGLAVGSLGLSLGALVLWVAPEGFKQANYVEAFTYRWIQLPPPHPAESPPHTPAIAPGVPGGFSDWSPDRGPSDADGLTVGCLVDSLTIAMFMVFALLNVLIQVFALGSSAEAAPRSRKFAFLALLNFALLGLVLANSLPQLFIFWELISLAAFFLVRLGTEPQTGPETPPSHAALRMYLMNLVGSGAFLLGMGILVVHTGTLAGLAFFDAHGVSILSKTIREALGVQSSEFLYFPGGEGFLQMHWLTWAGICFMVAALARMAQFPFQTWLHAVVEAPAEITVLVAAASLGAGVCLLARLFPILTLDTRFILAVVGGVTLAAGGAIALVQNDVRKILAWSTVSQGGYILLFLGAGGYEAGILQLFTHGFMKTALFMAAGTVVLGYGTADVRQMGGLWKRFPITAAASLAAVLALGGVPWMAGSYSTNLGLACVWDYAHALQATSGRHFEFLLFHLPAVFTYVTALGIGRWWWLIFAGENRNPKLYEAAHESAFLTFSIVLLVGTYAGVLYDYGGILKLIEKSVLGILQGHGGASGMGPLVITGSEAARQLVIRDTGWAFLGMVLAVLIHVRGTQFSGKIRRLPGVNILDHWLRERMFFDDVYEGVLLPGVLGLARLTGLVERAGRAIVKVLANIITLAVTFAAQVERKNQEALPEPADPQPGEMKEAGKPQD